jgi:hypothetical protein
MASSEDWIHHFSEQAKRESSGKRSIYSVSHPEKSSQPIESIQLVTPIEQTVAMARATLKRTKRLGRPPGSGTKKRKMGVVKKVVKGRKVRKIKSKKRVIKKRRVIKKKKTLSFN